MKTAVKSVIDIYTEYKIMPNLQLHQLRVAAVAKIICESLTAEAGGNAGGNEANQLVNTKAVVETCLFHDMGNIIKFHLDYFPEFSQPEGLEYWEKVKADYIARYGPSEHHATEQICKELGLSDKHLALLDGIGFTRAIKTQASGSLAQKICCYADQRVGPFGLLSLDERREDGRKRYANRKDKNITIEEFDAYLGALKAIEQEIFAHSSTKPEDITDEKVGDEIELLQSSYAL